jgi:hypothetical protein
MTSRKFPNPFELVTLMALIRNNIGMFVVLAQIHALFEYGDDWAEAEGPNPDFAEEIKRVVRALMNDAEASGNPLIQRQADRILSIIRKGERQKLQAEIKSLYQRMQDLFVGQTFYRVSSNKAGHYENPFAEWTIVSTSIPSATDAIEEAEKCFALGRNTACVFHCIEIMDKGLVAFAKHLSTGVNPALDTWETMIKGIEEAINRKRAKVDRSTWKSLEAFYDEALSDLRSVKNAWRNPTMHFRRTYTEEQAQKVLDRVRDFMTHLCSRVHERRAK